MLPRAEREGSNPLRVRKYASSGLSLPIWGTPASSGATARHVRRAPHLSSFDIRLPPRFAHCLLNLGWRQAGPATGSAPLPVSVDCLRDVLRAGNRGRWPAYVR